MNNHLLEHNHAFIKNGHIADILVFDESSHNSNIAEQIREEKGWDAVVDLCAYTADGKEIPNVDWEWNGSVFIPPTVEYLISIGRLNYTKPIEESGLTVIE